ncbi:hypothetical protein OIO90_000101 [Microbotryomycetes sp. JL221]|nr:hypothetical protein OIO90_000101 [Microbotryomycetes sp. JL221]
MAMPNYATMFDPQVVLNDPAFKLLPRHHVPKRDVNVNLSCAYGPVDDQHGPQLNLIEKPKMKPQHGQVVVHVRATGICGSDVHFWKHGRIGDTMVVRCTCGAGHESAGQVIELGPGVDNLKVGDRVAIEAGVPCGSCEFCKKGKYNACPDVVFFSTPPYHGTLTRYHVHPAAWLHKLPDSISFEEGSLLEPLAVALAGIERAQLKLGDPTLICGAGPIGLVSLLAAKAAGATPIVITDIAQSRLDFASKLVSGVQTVLVERGNSPKDVANKIKQVSGQDLGMTVSLECTGVESSVQTAIFSAKFGTTVFVIGVGNDRMTLPFMHMSANEIDLKLQYRYANQYPKAIRLVQGGLIDLKPLVTHRFALENAIEAFETAADINSGSIKCQILDDAL